MPLHRPYSNVYLFLAAGLSACLFSSVSLADVWVFEPSAAIDQRFDDNYTINEAAPDETIATRVVGTLGLSREAPNAKFAGLLRVDGLITNSSARGDQLNSNRIAFLSSQFTTARSAYGIDLNYKVDTPSRDISADLTDLSSVAADTRANVTQGENVARERIVVSPNWSYNLTRRTSFELDLDYTTVSHEQPSANDALRAGYAERFPDQPIPDPISVFDVIGGPGFFTVEDELDDFEEAAIDIGIKTKLSPITTLSFYASYSDFRAQVEQDRQVFNTDTTTVAAPDNKDVRRKNKRERRSNTTKFRLGYDRAFTPTLNVGAQVGIYSNETDDTDLLRITDPTNFGDDVVGLQQEIDTMVSKSTGYLANITATKNTGVTRYTAKFGVDVLPSDVGAQVESLEVVGDLFRQIGPLLDFSFRIRAYEPDALNADPDEKFSRRFLSLEPKLIWRFNRAWTIASSYRYRRQKSQAATRSGESNALLFSLKYTPPSAIRDAQLAN